MSKALAPALSLLCAAALLAPAVPAHSAEGDLTLGVAPAYTSLPTRGQEGQRGFGASLYSELRFNSFWGLTAGTSWSYQLSSSRDDLPGQHLGALWFGGLYNLDVASYVPFVTLSATAYLSEPTLQDEEGRRVNAGLRAGFGVDYRRSRRWSVGAEADLHSFLTDPGNYPVYLQVLLRLNAHFEAF